MHPAKASVEVEVYLHSFTTSALPGGVASFTIRPLYIRRSTPTPVSVHNLSGLYWEQKSFLSLPGIEPVAVRWSLYSLYCTGQCLDKRQELVPHAWTRKNTVWYATTNECYNEQFLSIKAGCYNKHRCYNERGRILLADVARACAWRVGPFLFY